VPTLLQLKSGPVEASTNPETPQSRLANSVQKKSSLRADKMHGHRAAGTATDQGGGTGLVGCAFTSHCALLRAASTEKQPQIREHG